MIGWAYAMSRWRRKGRGRTFGRPSVSTSPGRNTEKCSSRSSESGKWSRSPPSHPSLLPKWSVFVLRIARRLVRRRSRSLQGEPTSPCRCDWTSSTNPRGRTCGIAVYFELKNATSSTGTIDALCVAARQRQRQRRRHLVPSAIRRESRRKRSQRARRNPSPRWRNRAGNHSSDFDRFWEI